MTWDEISQLLDAELEDLQIGAPDLAQLAHRLDLVPDMLLDLEHHTNAALDAAVLEFAATRKWPPLSPTEQTMLVFRLEYAASLSSLFGHQPYAFRGVMPQPSLDVPEEHILEWLLTYAWQIDGFPALHDTCARLLRGVQPATTGDKSLP